LMVALRSAVRGEPGWTLPLAGCGN